MPSWVLHERYRQLLDEELPLVESRLATHRIALVYPNTYHIGMSSLGFQSVYRMINAHPDFSCERGFLPDPEMIDTLRRTRTPLVSVERQQPLTNFDILAFSFSFENDAFNVVRLLELAGIPILPAERNDHHPIIVLGGMVAQTNPEPLAPFADVMLLGDGEAVLPGFLDRYAAWREGRRGSRSDFLAAIRGLPGVYLPSDWQPEYDPATGVVRAVHYLPDTEPPTLTPPRSRNRDDIPNSSSFLTPHTEFRNMFLVEVGRGCPWKCNFCLVGHHVRPFKPMRMTQMEHILDHIPSQAVSVGLVSSAVADNKEIKDIMAAVLDRGFRFSLPSVNLNRVDADTLDLIDRAGLRTLTVAPEAGSDRLRNLINKRIANETFLNFGAVIAQSRVGTLKNYFLIGLPGETDDDVDAIARLVLDQVEVARAANPGRPRLRLTLSVNSFVPKPHTPFERFPMADARYLEAAADRLRRALPRHAPVEIHFDRPKVTEIQALLSIGDRRVSEFLRLVHEEDGHARRALKRWSGSLDFYVHRDKHTDPALAWSHLG